MNRLIIIGNGFDLANGLKTSYEDFLVWYLKSKISQVFTSTINYSDALVEIQYNHDSTDDFSNLQDIESINQILENASISWGPSKGVRFREALPNIDEIRSRPIKIKPKSQLFANLISSPKNWTDIEKAYFHALLNSKSGGKYLPSKYSVLNEEFECLKKELLVYITQVDEQFRSDPKVFDVFKLPKGSFFYNLLSWDTRDSILHPGLKTENTEILIVNFNYTNTIREYWENLRTPGGGFQIANYRYTR